MRNKYLLMLTLMVFMLFPIKVSAETTTQDTKCNYNSKAYLNKIAAQVKMAYEFKYDSSGNVSFDISIYNIKEDIYITLTDSLGGNTQIFPNMTSGGTYTFNVKNRTEIITYTASVRTLKFGCKDDIRKITLIKPKWNDISENSLCSNDYVSKSSYCQEWISYDFSLTQSDIEDILESEIEKHQKTEVLEPTEEEKEAEKEKINDEKKQKLKKYLIIALIIGIVVDTITIIIMTIRIRRYSI